MFSLFSIFIIYSKFLAIILFFYLIGKLIFSFYKKKSLRETETSISIFTGILISLLFYSIFKTHGKTLMLLLLPSIGGLIYINRINFTYFSWEKINFKKQILPILFISTLLFVYHLYFYVDFSSFNYKLLFADNYFYANVTNVLSDFGVENIDYTLNRQLPQFQHELLPYRYSDMWLNAIIMKFIDLSDIGAYYLVTVPVLISVVALFLFELIGSRIQNFVYKSGIVFVLLFLSIAFLPYLNPGNKLNYIAETSLMGVFQQKLAMGAICFILVYYYWNRNRMISMFIFSSIPILYVSFLPSVWGGMILYSCFQIVRNRKNFKLIKYYLITIIYVVSLFTAFYLFYYFNGKYYFKTNKTSILENPIISRLPKEFFEGDILNNYKLILSNFFYFSIPSIFHFLKGSLSNLLIGAFFYIPFILLLFDKLKKYKSNLFFFGICLLVGLLSVVLKEGDFNNYQFFTNFLMFFSLILTVVFIENLQVLRLKKYVFLGIVILCCMFPTMTNKATIGKVYVDQNFCQEVLHEIRDEKQVEIICLVSKDSFEKTFYDWYAANKYLYIKQLTSILVSFSIGNPEALDVKNEIHKKDYTYDWVPVKCWRDKTNKNELLEFMRIHKNKYLLVYPGVLLPNWLVKNTHTIIKSKEGYIFVSVNFNKK